MYLPNSKPMRLSKIVSKDPDVHSGDLCFAGTRIPVSTLIGYLRKGHSIDRYLQDYPGVDQRQIHGFLEWSHDQAEEEVEKELVLHEDPS